MSNKQHKTEFPVDALKSEAARQRWEMFHQAIAFAKESNQAAMLESDASANDAEGSGPLLTIVP